MAGRKKKVSHENHERWVLTYADVMNLLLILFIILYTMSQVDVAKFNQLAASLKAAFGDSAATTMMMQGANGNSIIPLDASSPSPVVSSSMEDQQMQAVKETVEKLAEKENLTGEVEVSIKERGVEISIKERVLFKPGSAQIEEVSMQTITGIGKVLLSIPGNHIRVEGHTDNDPINTAQFPSNWELSSMRATNVLRILVEKCGINPKIISSVGYGEFTPKVPNTTLQNKSANRRVDIVILKNMYDKAEAGISKAAVPDVQPQNQAQPVENKAKPADSEQGHQQ